MSKLRQRFEIWHETDYEESVDEHADIYHITKEALDLLDEMAEALDDFENDDGHIPVPIWEARCRALKKYEGAQ